MSGRVFTNPYWLSSLGLFFLLLNFYFTVKTQLKYDMSSFRETGAFQCYEGNLTYSDYICKIGADKNRLLIGQFLRLKAKFSGNL